MSVGRSTLSLQGTALENRGGQVQALGDATVDISNGTLDNTASPLRSGGTLTLRAAQVVNANTQGADQGLEGRSVNFIAALIDNRSGAVHADQSVTITATGVGRQPASCGSTDGSVVIQAGNAYRQVGSDVVANRGDVDILARRVDIVEAQTTGQDVQETKFKQSGLTIALSAPVISAVQGVQRMSQASGKTGDSRMKALAAANGAMSAYDAASAAGSLASGGDGGGISISITVGSTQNESRTTVDRTGTAGSSVRAGGDVRVQATGAGADSDLTVRGSRIEAGGNVGLKADGDLQLLAEQDSVTQSSKNSSSSANVGVAISLGQGGVAFGVTASASKGRGHADGADVSQVNTHITAGQRVDLDAGGDARLAGAVVSGEQVHANVGGDLSIESLQDTSRYASKQESLGGNVTVGAGFSGSANFNKSKVNADYASVVEQSGIRAGDDGFQVTVKGDTDLHGGVISSSQAAIVAQKNTLQTATLSTSDIENRDRFSASSVGLSGGYGQSNGTKDVGGVNMQSFKGGMNGTSMGVGRSSGSQSSMTRAGVSEAVVTLTDEAAQQARTGQTSSEVVASLNREVATGVDTSGALRRAWDGQALQEDVQAQAEITAEFGKNAAKSVGDHAGKKRDALRQDAAVARANGDEASAQQLEGEAARWDEGGVYRIALHAAAGALGGGVSGALGATASAAAAPALDRLQNEVQARLREAGADEATASAAASVLGAVTATAIGATAGGASGAASAFNADTNNRQLRHTEQDRIKTLANGDPTKEARLTAAACAMARCADGVPTNDPSYAFLKGLQDAGANLTEEKALLAEQVIQYGRTRAKLFTYDYVDGLRDDWERNAVGNRLLGGLQVVGGVALAGASGAACTAMVGCAAGVAGITVAADNVSAGFRTVATGIGTTTYGEQVFQSLGFSPEAAAFGYALVGLSPAVAESAFARRAASELSTSRKVGNAELGGTGLTVASNPATGNPAAIARDVGSLNARQAAALEQLPEFGSQVVLGKNFGLRDLAALTAETGDEFAMFTTGGRRLVFRGNFESVPISLDMAADLAGQGWRWSGHTHPGFSTNVLRSSPGDRAVLGAMGGDQSAIFNSLGQRGLFTPTGDSLNGWLP